MKFAVFISLAIALYIAAVVLFFLAIFDQAALVDQLNAMLPVEKRFDRYFANWKFFDFRQSYRASFPTSSRLKRNTKLHLAAMSLMFLAFILFGVAFHGHGS